MRSRWSTWVPAALLLGLILSMAFGGCSAKRAISSAGSYGFEEPESPKVVQAQPAPSENTPPVLREQPTTEETSRAQLVPPSPAPEPTVAPTPQAEPPIVSAPPEPPLPPAAPPSVGQPAVGQPAIGQPAITLSDIYFDFDRWTIKPEAQAVLESTAVWMKDHPDGTLVIEGHCDERGTAAYNMVLGEKRAKSAKRYLEDLGIAGSRLKTMSYGEVRPVCMEHDEGCWWKNRRAHFRTP